ncbi:hypothetical protein HPC49_54670 [Pyxidicoccus fallax]|uniref:Uncharacterized protein n=1 Tax=Pyxidicoccus fallax TaxID=394095 RepID=A0A848LPA1_9BACT|nr:hypothetical protein [Pyxidicoccus fallax]NMO19521.1 hypothetical protein [Pyxidicoccus fallax]NPC87211.1 hypothetical protein [Pyxidicoccus fallax]
MQDAFIAGGWGMYPTLLAGLALIATCLRYARRPESRYVPLMLSLGIFTLLAGALGFATGILSMLRYYTSTPFEHGTNLLYAGFYESLHNVALALLLSTLGALLASVGAWRLSHRTTVASAA